MNREKSLPSVSVMFLTRDRPALIERALKAVLEDPATTEAIVVVDGDNPATIAMLEGVAAKDARVRHTLTPPPDEKGLDNVQRGRDHGAELAAGDVVLALDDDVVARPGMVTTHARRHGADEGRLVVVGYMPVVTSPRWPRSYAPIRFYAESYEEHADEYERDSDYILRHLWGGNFSLRRSHWLEATRAGRVPCYHEDKEFGLLLERQGFAAQFERRARGDHWYQRDLRGFIQRARKTVPAQTQLRAAYSDVIDDAAWQDLPQRRSLQLLVRLSRRRLGWFVVRWALIAVTSIGAALRLRPLEDRGAEALWRVASELTETEWNSPLTR